MFKTSLDLQAAAAKGKCCRPCRTLAFLRTVIPNNPEPSYACSVVSCTWFCSIFFGGGREDLFLQNKHHIKYSQVYNEAAVPVPSPNPISIFKNIFHLMYNPFLKIFIYLFIWLCRVLVAAHGILLLQCAGSLVVAHGL